MKISASLYSGDSSKKVETLIELEEIGIDAIHLDCKDDFDVFNDFSLIRTHSSAIIDLHLISSTPELYNSLIQQNKPDWLTLQFENLPDIFHYENVIHPNWGLALTSETPLSAFEKASPYAKFILLMATTPGESGGKLNPNTFHKIREAKRKYPFHRIHVDGGVNPEIAFILRDMGVYASVSGSYLLKSTHAGRALHTLKSGIGESGYLLRDFMLKYDEVPTCNISSSFSELLQIMDSGKLGFVCILNDESILEGVCSNADLRKGLLKNIHDLRKTTLIDVLNKNPLTAMENWNVSQLMNCIQEANFPVLFLPVINESKKLTGAVTFNQLIKSTI